MPKDIQPVASAVVTAADVHAAISQWESDARTGNWPATSQSETPDQVASHSSNYLFGVLQNIVAKK